MASAYPGGTGLGDSVSHPEQQREAGSVFAASALYAQGDPSSSATRQAPIRPRSGRSCRLLPEQPEHTKQIFEPALEPMRLGLPWAARINDVFPVQQPTG